MNMPSFDKYFAPSVRIPGVEVRSDSGARADGYLQCSVSLEDKEFAEQLIKDFTEGFGRSPTKITLSPDLTGLIESDSTLHGIQVVVDPNAGENFIRLE